MITTSEYGYSAASGAFVILAMDSIDNDHPWLAAMSVIGFLVAVWLVRLQPSNVNDGVIVHVDARDVTTFVDGRPIAWCGNRELHNLHTWFPTHELVDETGDIWATRDDPMSVCLGHECHCPDAHLEKAVTK